MKSAFKPGDEVYHKFGQRMTVYEVTPDGLICGWVDPLGYVSQELIKEKDVGKK